MPSGLGETAAVSPLRTGGLLPTGTCGLRKGKSSACLLSSIKRTVKPFCACQISLDGHTILRKSQDVWEVLVLPVGASRPAGALTGVTVIVVS